MELAFQNSMVDLKANIPEEKTKFKDLSHISIPSLDTLITPNPTYFMLKPRADERKKQAGSSSHHLGLHGW